MKIVLALIGCLLLFPLKMYAQNGNELPVPPEADQEEATDVPGPADQQEPADQQMPPVQQSPAGNAVQSPFNMPARQVPSRVPGAVPGAGVTPGQIKAFLARPQEENFIILNFDSASLKDVINTVASITNENFILTPGVDAQITIHSSKKIPVSEVMDVFESVLEVNGMALVKSGDFFKIVPGATAKQKTTEVRTGGQTESLPDRDRPVTQIVPVQYVPVAEISTVLTPLLSPVGSIIPNPRNSLLVINDLSSNIIRLLDVLKEIDVNVFENTRMLFFKPKFSDVITLSNDLTEVLNALNLPRDGVALLPVERINSLVIFSPSPSLLEAVEGWIRKLDEEVISGQNIFVYPVQNVKAENIAEILNKLYQAGEGTTVKRTAPPQAKQPTQQRGRTTTQQRTTPRSRVSSETSGGSRVKIITFEPTNSLIIFAPPGIYREMVQTIRRIDIYPREVLIEAVIAEVTLSDSEKLGIQWSLLRNLNIESKEYTGLAQSTSGSENFPTLVSTAPALVSGPSGGLSFILYRPDRLMAMINALASASKVKVLSSPSLLVRDQEEASIEVGSDIPTASSTTSTTTTDTLTQNIEYRTVGIKLKIKPTISEEKTVVLDIEQEVSSKGDSLQVGMEGNLFPSFSTTKTKTSIVVPHQQGIIIGGIMEEKKDKNYQGIPFFSTIPIFGKLFRYTVDATTKKELIIFITPHVLVDKTEADVLTKEYLDKLRELKTYFGNQDVRLKGAAGKE